MLAEIEGSSFTARGRSECIMQLNLVASEGRLDERSWEQNFFCMQLNIFAVLRHVSFGERIISFERAKTNHDKVAVF